MEGLGSTMITDPVRLREILLSSKTIAVVGLSSNPEKDSHGIAQYLQGQGYRIIPVNPTASQILGERSYPSLTSIPEPLDVVQIFRRSEDVPPIVDEAIAIGAKTVWMQEGIVNLAAAEKATAAGLNVVMDRCMRLDHQFLIRNPKGR
jgi:predicted CoA-binding protein